MDCACDASWRFGGLASGCNTVVQERLVLSSIAPPSRSRPAELRPLVVDHVDPDVLSQLTCFICLDIVDRPVRTKCDHLACLNCLVGQYLTLQSGDDWICSAKDCETVFYDSSQSISFSKAGSFCKPYGLVESSIRSLKVAAD